MLTLHRFTTPDEPCVYLPDRVSRLRYEMAMAVSAEEYEARMNQGWRKFGPMLFQPACPSCRECRPIRIDAERFTPDRSQRRAARRNEGLRLAFGPPRVDASRLDLYDRYHRSQADRKGWPGKEPKDEEEYAFSFVQNEVPAVEITAWEAQPEGGESLRLVVLTEVTPNAVSGIYHYHDPDLHDRGLGTFGMIQTIELARRLQKPWAYFGFYVAGCGSLRYKARFQPCELLGEDGVWRPFTEGQAEAAD